MNRNWLHIVAITGGQGVQTAFDLASQHPHILILLDRNNSKVQPMIDSIASNYLGHFLLTNLLVPVFVPGCKARIVNVSSEGHAYAPQKLNGVRDINYSKDRKYNGQEVYGMSKLANILFAKSLAAKLREGASVLIPCIQVGGQEEVGG